MSVPDDVLREVMELVGQEPPDWPKKRNRRLLSRKAVEQALRRLVCLERQHALATLCDKLMTTEQRQATGLALNLLLLGDLLPEAWKEALDLLAGDNEEG
jgi:hypothetical protein